MEMSPRTASNAAAITPVSPGSGAPKDSRYTTTKIATAP